MGSTHCLALTDDGEVHSWGSNDKLQHFDTLFSNKKQPKALPGLNSKHIVGIACGPGQVLITLLCSPSPDTLRFQLQHRQIYKVWTGTDHLAVLTVT